MLEATGAGGLIIESAVANSGSLWASGGDLQAQAVVTGDGSATIAAGTLEFGAASDVSATFNGAGTLKLDLSSGFTGTISGFGGQDSIDLSDIAFGAQTTLGYAQNQNNTGGTLTVSDGVHTANLTLLGNYIASSFVAASDGHGGTLVTDPALIAAASPLSLTQPRA
jgi:large repetitive protein